MDGIINVYKERGYTSHDVVAKLRGILHQKKIGHTGTLDPEAEGVLPVCLGRATKVCDLLTDWDKEYRADLLLGITTDTQDMTGTVLKMCPVFLHTGRADKAVYLTENEIRSCIETFIGEIEQTPPMYSALKVNGKKLYQLARQGIEIELKPRRIQIFDILITQIHEKKVSVSLEDGDIAELSAVEVQITVRCSKGTYIRTLCSDIGEKLGCGGCMSALLRTEVGPFHLTDAWRLSKIEELRDENRLKECLHPTDSVFMNLEAVQLTPEAERLVCNGNPLSPEMMAGCRKSADADERFPDAHSRECKNRQQDSNCLRLYGQNGAFLAVYEFNDEKHSWRARKMFL